MTKNLQHIQVPHDMCKTHELEPYDMLVYANIKRYMNNETRTAFPTIETLKKSIGSGSDKIIASINKLRGKYIKIYNKDKKNHYIFPKTIDHFEPFSPEFLDMQDLSIQEKSYIIAVQQYMFKDLKNWGKISFTRNELSKLINMPLSSIYKYETSLVEKGYMETFTSRKKDKETGCFIVERRFNMRLLHQGLIWKIAKHLQAIKSNNAMIKKLQKDLRKERQRADAQGFKIAEIRRGAGLETNFLVI